MAEKIKLITDSASDISKQTAEELGIEILPITITVDDKVYRDIYDITSGEFCNILKTCSENTKFSTAQPNLELFLDTFRKWATDGYKIICVTISSAGSGTFQTANLAKQYLLDEMDAQIEIIDSLGYSKLYGYPIEEAAKKIIDGASCEEVLNYIKSKLPCGNAFFVTDTLKFLKKGGRIKPAVAMIGEILNIKPVLVIDDGVINSLEKIRGSKKVVPRIIELLKNTNITPDCKIYIVDGGDENLNNSMSAALKDAFGIEDVEYAKIGPTILLHTGPGLTGVIYFKKP